MTLSPYVGLSRDRLPSPRINPPTPRRAGRLSRIDEEWQIEPNGDATNEAESHRPALKRQDSLRPKKSSGVFQHSDVNCPEVSRS